MNDSWLRQVPGDVDYDSASTLATGYETRDALKIAQDAAKAQYKAAESGLMGLATNALNAAKQQASQWQMQADESLRGIQSHLTAQLDSYTRQREEAEARVAELRRQPTPDMFGRTDFGPSADTSVGLPEAPLTTREADETLDTSGFAPDITKNLSEVGKADEQAWLGHAERFTKDLFQAKDQREPTPQELSTWAPGMSQAFQTGLNMGGADVTGSADDVAKGIARAASKFGSQPETQRLIEDIGASTGGFAEARGVDLGKQVKSLATQAAEREAAAQGLDPTNVVGKASELARLRAEFAAMRDAATTVGDNFNARLASMRARKEAGEAVDPAELGQLEAEFAQAKDLVSEVFGMRAEGGRMVAENRRQASGLDALKRLVDMVGGEGTSDQLAERLMSVDLTNPESVAEILKVAQGQRRKPDIGQLPLGLEDQGLVGSQPRMLGETEGYPSIVPEPQGGFGTIQERSAASAQAFAYQQAEESSNLMGDAWKAYQDQLDEIRAGLTPREAALADQAAQGFSGRARGVDVPAGEAGETAAVQTTLPGLTPPSGKVIPKETAERAATEREKAIEFAAKRFGQSKDNAKLNSWVQAYDNLTPGDVVAREKLLAMANPSTPREKILAFTVSNMFGIKTVVTNALGGFIETGTRLGEEALTPGYGPTAAVEDLVAMWRARGQGAANAITAFTEGVRPSRLTKVGEEGAQEAAQNAARYDVRRDAFIGKQGMAYTPMLRATVAGDEFWRTVNAAGGAAVEARRLARRRGVRPEDVLNAPEVQAAAEKAARLAVLEEGGSRIGRGLGRAKEGIYSNKPGDILGGLVTHVLVPFSGVPDVMLFKPLRTMASPAVGLYKLAKGDTAGAAKEAGRSAMGGLVLGALWGESIAGNITGSGPKDFEQRALLEQATDKNGDPIWQANAVRIPDPTRWGPGGIGHRWVPLQAFGSWAVPAVGMANAVDAYRYEGKKPDPEYASAMFNGVTKGLLDFSYVKQLGDFFKAIGEGRTSDILPQIAANTLSRGVPIGGLFAQGARASDQEQKEYSPGARGIPERIAARIPIASNLVPDKVGVYGKPVNRPVDVLSSLFQMSGPGKVDHVSEEVGRLVQSGQRVPLRSIGPNESFAGVKQEPDTRRTIQKSMGLAAAAYLNDFIARDEYQTLDDAGKAETLAKAVNTAYEIANLKLGESVKRDSASQNALAWATVPQYAGVSGTPEQIRLKNFETAQAHAKLADYKKKYGAIGEYRLYQEDQEAWKLANRPRLDSRYLDIKRGEVNKQYPVEKSGAVLGAGNTVVPMPDVSRSPAILQAVR